jgi:hypothetical protein
MLNWFRSPAVCPVEPQDKEWIERRMLWLAEQFGRERMRTGEVVLPIARYYPDAFDASPQAAALMLARTCEYMDIDPNTVELYFYEEQSTLFDEQGRLGTSGLYNEALGKFQIGVEVSNLRDPLAMVATIAHELGHVHLLGQGRLADDAEDGEPLTDLLTVFLGMGVFTANAVIREENWHSGLISGWSMGRRGYLTMPMYGYALALFAWERGEENPEWSKVLRTDVRTAYKAGLRYLHETGDSLFQPSRETE